VPETSPPGTPTARQVEKAAGLLKLVGEPGRMNILVALDRGGELSVGELAVALGASPSQMSARLTPLRIAGLVVDRRDSTVKRYSLTRKGRLLMDAARVLFLLD
jgi:DNA-binding transcriptional ArsR family regulator